MKITTHLFGVSCSWCAKWVFEGNPAFVFKEPRAKAIWSLRPQTQIHGGWIGGSKPHVTTWNEGVLNKAGDGTAQPSAGSCNIRTKRLWNSQSTLGCCDHVFLLLSVWSFVIQGVGEWWMRTVSVRHMSCRHCSWRQLALWSLGLDTRDVAKMGKHKRLSHLFTNLKTTSSRDVLYPLEARQSAPAEMQISTSFVVWPTKFQGQCQLYVVLYGVRIYCPCKTQCSFHKKPFCDNFVEMSLCFTCCTCLENIFVLAQVCQRKNMPLPL